MDLWQSTTQQKRVIRWHKNTIITLDDFSSFWIYDSKLCGLSKNHEEPITLVTLANKKECDEIMDFIWEGSK